MFLEVALERKTNQPTNRNQRHVRKRANKRNKWTHTHAHTHTEKQSEIKKQTKQTNRSETPATSKEQGKGVAVGRTHIKREMTGVGKRKNIYIY